MQEGGKYASIARRFTSSYRNLQVPEEHSVPLPVVSGPLRDLTAVGVCV